MINGGVKGSQERKERAMDSLIADGLVEKVMLAKPIGRANHQMIVTEAGQTDEPLGKYDVA